MTDFTFHIAPLDQEPTIRTRSLSDDAEALAYARQLLKDWPECRQVDVRRDGELLGRLHGRLT